MSQELTTTKCSCEENAEIEANISFDCKKCSKNVGSLHIEKPFKAAIVTAILAYGGSQFIDYAVTDNRYPTKIEYELIDSCLSSYSKPISYSVYGSKKQVCLCALEDTMNEISYVRYRIDEDGFMEAFEENAISCVKDK